MFVHCLEGERQCVWDEMRVWQLWLFVFFSWRVLYLSDLVRLWTPVHRCSDVVLIFTDVVRMST